MSTLSVAAAAAVAEASELPPFAAHPTNPATAIASAVPAAFRFAFCMFCIPHIVNFSKRECRVVLSTVARTQLTGATLDLFQIQSFGFKSSCAGKLFVL